MGCLTWERFLELAKRFVEVSDQFNDGWELKSITSEPKVGETYIVKKDIKMPKARQEDSITQIENEISPKKPKTEDSLKDDMELDPGNKTVYIWEYHILYSSSYSVPVLYFNISETNGKRLTYEETLSKVLFEKRLLRNLGSSISQTEHPLLRKPFYFMHPCQTSKIFIEPRHNMLVTWLSCVAPVVNLSLRSGYAAACLVEPSQPDPAEQDAEMKPAEDK